MAKRGNIGRAAVIFAAILVLAAAPAGTAFAAQADETVSGASQTAETGVLTVEYGDLLELLKQGNFSLTETQTELDESLEPYRKVWQSLKDEEAYMERMADSYEDDGDTEMQAQYENNAKQLKRAAAQINSTIKRMSGTSQEKSLEDQADSLTKTAQTLMISYKQAELQLEAAEKNVEAAGSSYEETVRKQEAGMAKEAEAESAKNTLESRKNSLESAKIQEAELKESLLTMLGMSGRTDVTFGEIPEPDLEAIAALDYEADEETAITNDSTYASEMLSSVKGTDARNLRQQRIDAAIGTAKMNLLADYESVQTAKTEYEAAKHAFAAAEQDYDAIQRKEQAGLLTKTEILEGEASYLSVKLSMETASMNLYQAYETYLWRVKGVA